MSTAYITPKQQENGQKSTCDCGHKNTNMSCNATLSYDHGVMVQKYTAPSLSSSSSTLLSSQQVLKKSKSVDLASLLRKRQLSLSSPSTLSSSTTTTKCGGEAVATAASKFSGNFYCRRSAATSDNMDQQHQQPKSLNQCSESSATNAYTSSSEKNCQISCADCECSARVAEPSFQNSSDTANPGNIGRNHNQTFINNSSSIADLIIFQESQSLLDTAEPSSSPTVASSPSSSTDTTSSPSDLLSSIMKLIIGEPRKLTVGRISLLMLILFTVTDVLVGVVHSQVQSLESPELYDVFSADVIRPPFKYHRSSTSSSPVTTRSSLGSAAISSVTEALSPILPFTGGLDLRREEFWTSSSSWFDAVSNGVQQVREAFGIHDHGYFSFPSSTFGGVSSSKWPSTTSTTATSSITQTSKAISHELSLSATEPFLPVSKIAGLTLADITVAFEYATQSTRPDFHQNRFMNGLSERVKDMVVAIDKAASRSRGSSLPPAMTSTDAAPGDVDALLFCAAMRIFAEWRVVRQVPEGYKGYAVGMTLGQKDVVQNLAKIEQAAHSWIDFKITQQDNSNDEDDTRYGLVTAPTIRDLLQHELDMNIHDKLPRLKDKTAAMGLLWVRRQFEYQATLFGNLLEVQKFGSTQAAVASAYSDVYDKYHGWAVQKIFNYSFQSAPEPSVVYRNMNPHKLQQAKEEAQQLKNSNRYNNDSSLILTKFTNENDDKSKDEGNPFEKFVKHIQSEWHKFVTKNDDGERVPQGITATDNKCVFDVEQYIKQEMDLDARQHISIHLETAIPLLQDLAGIFKEMNMDDPTKV